MFDDDGTYKRMDIRLSWIHINQLTLFRDKQYWYITNLVQCLPGLLPLSSGGSAGRSGEGSRRRRVDARSRSSCSGLRPVEAVLASSWSGRRDLCGQISVLALFFIVLLLLWLEPGVAERSTVPPRKLVAGSSVVCGFFAVVPHLAGRGGEVVRRYGEVGVVVLLSACRGGEGEKLFAAPSSAHRRSWMWRDSKSPLCSGRLGGRRAWETLVSACIEARIPASASMHIPLLQIGAHHMASLLVAMICGQDGSHLSRCCASASTTSMAKALEGDPCRRSTPPGCQVVSSPAIGRRSPATASHRRWRRSWAGLLCCIISRVFFVNF
jgi:hypothetical protein